jgi:NADPH:quinone reductase
MRAIRVERYGDPEVLEPVELEPPSPGPSQVLVEVAACGVNYVDTYQRSGLYRIPLPFVPGAEGAGTVVATGTDVPDLSVGDRVGWVAAPGSYSQQVLVDADRAIPLPASISEELAAAVLLQGLTAEYLTTSTYAVREGDEVLLHAAAGGVGLLLTQMVKLRGARVIATVSTAEKEALARAAGADEVIRYDQADFAEEVRGLTGGKGVDVVYDGVGKSTFDRSMASLRPRGLLVLFGAASGPVPPVDPRELMERGSLFLTRPTLRDYTATSEELRERARHVFDWIASGQLQVRIGGRYALEDARQAHEDLQGRRTTGKLLLLPG